MSLNRWVLLCCALALPCVSAANLLIYLGPPDSASPPVPALDTDVDGMDDTWELSVFGSLLPGADTDADGDGVINLHEYANGSDPMVSDLPASQLPRDSQFSAGQVDLVVFTPAG
jgi:hypothetical protein